MRDAFGGVFMIRLLLVFIFVYVIFAAISLNYAKAFRIKNKVISFIEEQDITDISQLFSEGDSSRLDELGNMLSSLQYNLECTGIEGLQESEDPLSAQKYCYHGIVIEEKNAEEQKINENNHVIRYNVSSYVKLDLSFMNNLLGATGKAPKEYDVYNGIWKITGEAKIVKRINPEENTNGESVDASQDDFGGIPINNQTNTDEQNDNHQNGVNITYSDTDFHMTRNNKDTNNNTNNNEENTDNNEEESQTSKPEELTIIDGKTNKNQYYMFPYITMNLITEMQKNCHKKGKDFSNYKFVVPEQFSVEAAQQSQMPFVAIYELHYWCK